ncbi:MAG: Ig-like domain-containing protein, partial [Patescibacteria group bacterium]
MDDKKLSKSYLLLILSAIGLFLLTFDGTITTGREYQTIAQIFLNRSSSFASSSFAWKSYTDAVNQGIIQTHQIILEIQLAYDVEGTPPLRMTKLYQKNGYAPLAKAVPHFADVKDPGELAEIANTYMVSLKDGFGNTLYSQPFVVSGLVLGLPLLAEDASLGDRGEIILKKFETAVTVPWIPRAKTVVITASDGQEIGSVPVAQISRVNNRPNFQVLRGEEVRERVLKERSLRYRSSSLEWLKQSGLAALSSIISFFKHFTEITHAQTSTDGYLDIVFVSEDYIASEFATFRNDVDGMASALITYEPFNTRASQVRYHYVENTEDLGCVREASIPRLFKCNISTIKSVVNNSGVPYDQIVVLVNTLTYGGAGYIADNVTITYRGTYAKEVFVHELGHSLGNLWDEYVLFTSSGTLDNKVKKNCYAGNPPAAEWAGIIPETSYYLECQYRNWYRTSLNSIMRVLNARYFNVVSQKYLNEELNKAAGSFSAGDAVLPTVSITSPSGGATVSGTVSVSVSASDNIGVTKVELWKNGALFGTLLTSPYTFSWGTTTDNNGSHTLQAHAFDATGNKGSSATISVTVSNISDT